MPTNKTREPAQLLIMAFLLSTLTIIAFTVAIEEQYPESLGLKTGWFGFTAEQRTWLYAVAIVGSLVHGAVMYFRLKYGRMFVDLFWAAAVLILVIFHS